MAIDRTALNAKIDSDGTPGSGSGVDKAFIEDVIFDPVDAAIAAGAGGATIQTTTSTGTVHDFAATAARHLILRCNNATLLTLTGFVAGTAGDVIDVISVGAGQVNLSHQTGSAAANQLLNCATSAPTSLAAGTGTARYVYDGTTTKWRLLAHEQGAWITPTFAAGDYTTNGAGGITVEAADVDACHYWLKGRSLYVGITLRSITLTAATSTQVVRLVPGGYSSAKLHYVSCYIIVNGVEETGMCQVSGTTMTWFRVPAANWTAGANTTGITANTMLEVT